MLKRMLAGIFVLLMALPALASADEARITSVDATSWIVGSDPTAYIPAKMIDGDETTSYQFSLKTTPLGQAYVYFYLAGPSDVSTLWIKNGFWRFSNGYDQYLRNCRVKRMTVDFRYSGSGYFTDPVTVTLPDDKTRADWTQVNLGSHSNVTAVRFQILDVYTGSKYKNDVCISEVRFSDGSSVDLYGLAIDKLATRDGPGTQYNGKGTYSVKGQYIKVLSRAWDSRNGIWWVKCEIPYHGEIRVLWTGYKRFDPNTLPLESIPIENFSAGTTAAPVTAAPQTAAPVQTGTWRDAYRQFVTSGTYRQHITCSMPEMYETFTQRNTAYDSIALYDLNGDGTPELLILSEYGVEQADVFTYSGGSVRRLGTMGGDNFFQYIFYYPGTGYTELFAALGGPAMDIRSCKIQNGVLTETKVAFARTNADGDGIVGIDMYVNDGSLFAMLYATFVGGRDASQQLQWFSISGLRTDSDWNGFFNSDIR